MKSAIVQKPKIASISVPDLVAHTNELTPSRFCPMMRAPASPKPTANRAPTLIMVCSRMVVSISSGSFPPAILRPQITLSNALQHAHAFLIILHSFNQQLFHVRATWDLLGTRNPLDGSSAAIAPRRCSLERLLERFAFTNAIAALSCVPRMYMWMAWIGFRLMLFTVVMTRSSGMRTKLFASLENIMEPPPRSKTMNNVMKMFRIDSMRTPERRSKTTTTNRSMSSCSVPLVEKSTVRSW
mmetsp:Transcript_128586/g.274262  ORF Transcript_128586/g.274262 Transcript_128586/m.274262 type:complete len:241 (+) Transcript_128586:967-1689(+)